MPDRHGFNHLGDHVRCIDCPTGGPLGRWPEHKRAQHAHSHRRAMGASNLRRQRPLLAASPPTGKEEKEATMATTKNKAASAKQVAIDVLRQAGEPLPAKEIAKRVLASGRCVGLKGKTPEATISAMLAVGSKPGGPFTRVAKGTYTFSDTATTGGAESGKAAAAMRGLAGKTAAASEAKSERAPRRVSAPKRPR